MTLQQSNDDGSRPRTKEERALLKIKYFEKFKAQYPYFFSNGAAVRPSEKTLKAPPSLALVDLSKKEMAKVPIDDLQKSVLCGTIIADSSLAINKGYANARIQNRHSTRQAAWFFWKWMVCLGDFNRGISSVTLQDADGKQKKSPLLPGEKHLGKLKISTAATPTLTALHSVICKSGNGKKTIERRWLNHMTNYFLMTVWLDDGSLMHRRQGARSSPPTIEGVICLDETPLVQQKTFVDYLRAVWGIEAYIQQKEIRMANGEYAYIIHIKDMQSLLKLLRIVAPIVPVKEMLYKILFVPLNNTDLLQRWASEVTELVLPEFRDYVREYYDRELSTH
jgi:hypothetical protein